jgi:hypothetical protein
MKNFTQPAFRLYLGLFLKIIICTLWLLCIASAAMSADAGNDRLFASITVPPASKSACAGSTTTFTVTATGGALTYTWQVSTDNGVTFNNITATANYTGFNTSTLTISNTPATFNGNRYRVIVTDGTPATSAAAVLTVNALPDVEPANISQSVCQGGGTSLPAKSGVGYTYVWQVSTDNGGSWSAVPNASPYLDVNTTNLKVNPAMTTMSGYLYRVQTFNGTCTATSGVDTLLVYEPSVSTPANSVAFCTGNTVTLPVTATSPLGASALSYIWQIRTSPTTYANLADDATYSGTIGNTLSIANIPSSLDGAGYKLVVTDSKGCFAEQAISLVRNQPAIINTAPPDTTLCAGIRLFLRGTGSNVLSYLWQSDNGTNGVTWTTVSTNSIYNIPAVSTAINGHKYKFSVSDVCGGSVSRQLTVTVRRSGTWYGTKDIKWEEPLNWCGGVPDNTIDVLIPNSPFPPFMPNISDGTGTAFFKSIVIESATRLTISGGTVDNMTGPFDIQGTVAYTAPRNQPVFPANHGSLEINGSGNKVLGSNVDISHNLVLGGAAKLVTGTNIITMKTGSNPIVASPFTDLVATSWIVTGNGTAGAANTGLGGLRIEQIDAADGAVLFPIGPTPVAYNPIQLTNAGTLDHFTIAVNDQVIPGGIIDAGINRTWLVSEAVPNGSSVTLSMKWLGGEEQAAFDRTQTKIIRSNGAMIVESSASAPASGTNPFARAGGSFVTLSQFSVASTVVVLPVELKSFTAQKTGSAAVGLTWNTTGSTMPKHFTVQRSADGVHFVNISQVNGETGKGAYNYSDNLPGSGTVYYRLMITGQQEEITYSGIQTVLLNGTNLVQLRPSATTGSTTQLYIQTTQQSVVSVYVTDIAGRIHSRQSVQFNKGEHLLPVWIGGLPKGVYYVHVKDSKGDINVLTLVKQ